MEASAFKALHINCICLQSCYKPLHTDSNESEGAGVYCWWLHQRDEVTKYWTKWKVSQAEENYLKYSFYVFCFNMKYLYIIETGCILYEWADRIQSFLFSLWEEGVNNITKIQFKNFHFRFLFNVEMSKIGSMMCIVKQISIYILNIQALLKPECVQYARICARKSPYLINIGRLHPTS